MNKLVIRFNRNTGKLVWIESGSGVFMQMKAFHRIMKEFGAEKKSIMMVNEGSK